jgi:hypothetical protein
LYGQEAPVEPDDSPLGLPKLLEITENLRKTLKDRERSVATAKMARGMARSLGLSVADTELLYKSALAHDAGYQLLDPDKLTRIIAAALFVVKAKSTPAWVCQVARTLVANFSQRFNVLPVELSANAIPYHGQGRLLVQLFTIRPGARQGHPGLGYSDDLRAGTSPPTNRSRVPQKGFFSTGLGICDGAAGRLGRHRLLDITRRPDNTHSKKGHVHLMFIACH